MRKARNIHRQLTAVMTAAALAPMTLAASPSTVACAAGPAKHAPAMPPSPQSETVDLRERSFQVAYLHLDEAGLALGDVHGGWSTTSSAGDHGLARVWPFQGQTRTATTVDPVVIEGEWIGKLHTFALELFTHLPQEGDAPAVDNLGMTVAIDGRTFFDGDVETVRRDSLFDCHRLYYGSHHFAFDGVAQAMATAGLESPGPHVLRLEIRPASAGAAPGIPLVFGSHWTRSAALLNAATDWTPTHTLQPGGVR